ncbi:MAG: PilX N-terminal domain-containing pilus assembly protein [Desulfurivibrio sp.]|nr:PilX N-terminal domain-containing pilus assembly protein [Desulfurivibrio sp.]
MTTQKIIQTPLDNGQEKGYVLVGALLIMLLLMLIGISASRSASLELQIAAADRAHQKLSTRPMLAYNMSWPK